MEAFDLAEAAERSGYTVADFAQLVALGIVTPGADGRFGASHVRRAGLVRSLTAAGIQLDGLGAAVRGGTVSLDFLEAPAFERFSALSGETFAEVAERIGVPVEQLMLVREATGSTTPRPGDRIRDAELAYAELIEVAVEAGFRPAAMEQMLRTQGENLRRVAETESALWLSEVIEPAVEAGHRPDEVLGAAVADRMSALIERAMIDMYHLQQARAWTSEIIEWLELQLAAAGLHSRLELPPAMCFIDISGYTRLTQERGDAAAAELAGRLSRIVQRVAVQHAGEAVKSLGDGVMVHFPNAADAVVGALEMVRAVAGSGLPPAHVGLHAGPVIFQEGDYYGSTVNLASRISDRAGPGQVLVSKAVVDASRGAPVVFREVGPAELKGVAAAVLLFEASHAD